MHRTLIAVTLIVGIPLTGIAAPASSSLGVSSSSALDNGINVSGLRLQRVGQRPFGKSPSVSARFPASGVPEVNVGLRLSAAGQAFRIDVDVVRMATSVLPGGRYVRFAASGLGAAQELLAAGATLSGTQHSVPTKQNAALFVMQPQPWTWPQPAPLAFWPPKLTVYLPAHLQLFAQPELRLKLAPLALRLCQR